MKKRILIIKSDSRKSQLPLIIKNLSEDNFKFNIFSSDRGFLSFLDDKKIDIHFRRGITEPITFGDWFFFVLLSPFLWFYIFTRLVIQRVKKHKVLILTSLTEKVLITPWARLLGYKVFWFENDFYPSNFRINVFSFFFRLWSRLATLISTSRAINDYLIKDFKIKGKNLRLINRGVDLANLKAQSKIYDQMVSAEYQIQNKALFIIGFVGELKIENGVEYIIKVVDHIKSLIPDFQIIIVGDGPQKKSLIWLTKTLGLGDRIRFVGQQANTERWYEYFNVLVLPRITKTNFSNSVAQAMALGLPVVASDLPGISELVNNQGGILVEPKNSEQFSQALFQLYNDKSLYQKFSEQAQARIKLNYSLPKMLSEYRDLLNN